MSNDPCRHPRPAACRVAVHILLGIGLGLLLAVVFGWALMFLWNLTVPGLFHLPAIGFWQAVALLVMARLLFGRINHGPSPHRLRRHYRRTCCVLAKAGCGRWPRRCGEPETEA